MFQLLGKYPPKPLNMSRDPAGLTESKEFPRANGRSSLWENPSHRRLWASAIPRSILRGFRVQAGKFQSFRMIKMRGEVCNSARGRHGWEQAPCYGFDPTRWSTVTWEPDKRPTAVPHGPYIPTAHFTPGDPKLINSRPRTSKNLHPSSLQLQFPCNV